MNFWTFADRNMHWLALVLVLAYSFGSCGSRERGEGCRVQIGGTTVAAQPDGGP